MISFSQLRQQAGLSTEEARELLKLSVETAAEYECGARLPIPREIQVLKGLALGHSAKDAKSSVI